MQVTTADAVYFWMPDSIYSNFYPKAPLVLPEYPDIKFENSEAAFMFLKAMTFGDIIIAEMIVRNQDPRECKKQGRRINSYDEEIWAEKRYNCMLDVVFAKFSQNPKLKAQLLATETKTLVEASPVDKIWGVGLAPNDPKVLNPANWKGLNLLGEVLMDVRTVLVNSMIRSLDK